VNHDTGIDILLHSKWSEITVSYSHFAYITLLMLIHTTKSCRFQRL